MNSKVVGVILAGGQSKRMGQDKAVLCLNGSTLLTRTYNLLKQVKPHLHEIVVSSGWLSSIAFFDHPHPSPPPSRGRGQDPHSCSLLPCGGGLGWGVEIHDLYPNLGPVGGIYSVIQKMEVDQCLLVIPVDMPLMTADAIGHLIHEGKTAKSFETVIYKDQPFPLFIRLTQRVLACFEEVKRTLFDESRTISVQNLLERLLTHRLDCPPVPLFANLFTNVNTPEELTRLLKHEDFGA